ncbi:MAG TPA: CoA transferase [Mycobacteriales bacterium]|nr:CoA transferase [Mycobacteriales bacterium]
MAEADAARPEVDLPLAGIRVLDLVTGPLAAVGRQLAEWGADVLRIEPPGGADDRRAGRTVGDVSIGFVAANLGKRAGSLDLKSPAGRRALDELLEGADVVLESTRPGSDDAADLDVDGIRARHPGLVVLSITPFGRAGVCSRWEATGPVLHALSGELSRSGLPGRAPLLPPGDLAYECAAGQAVFVVLLALLERLRTGEGDHLDFAVLDGVVHALDPGYGIAGSATAGVPASKLPRGRPDAGHQYPIIRCADGFVRICILAARQWRGMFAWMGSPEEFADPSYEKLTTRYRSPTLLPAIGRFFADQTRAELEAGGHRHGVPTAAVLEVDEAVSSEHVQARRAFVPFDLIPGDLVPGVTAPLPDGVAEIDGRRAGLRGPAPVAVGDGPAWSAAGGDVTGTATTGTATTGTATADASDRPLAGLRVLDLGVIVVGAEHGRLLADQGADVIKVENEAFPDGSRQSAGAVPMTVTFAAGHRNKRSLGLDLRSPRGKELFLQLVADTDIVLSNFRPGTLESLGLGYDVLSRVNPRVIVVDSSAFGPSGPWSSRLGYGPLVRASAGLTAQWRYDDDPAGFADAITVYPDHVAARLAIAAALALLVRRRRTGRGGTVSVSQLEVMLGHMAATLAEASLVRQGLPVEGRRAESVPWGAFPAAGDDEWCVITVRDDDDWQSLVKVMQRDDLVADAGLAAHDGRMAARARIEAAVTDWLAERRAADAAAALQAVGVPAAEMLRVSELPEHPYFAERFVFRPSGHPAIRQTFFLENAPVRSQRLPDPPDRPAPLRGEHTEQIARERLGLDEATIAELVRDGVLQPPT